MTLSSGIKVVKQSGPEGEVKQGDSVAFEVEVESALGVVYQWVKRSGGGEEILAGEVYSRLVLDGVGSGDVGEYVAERMEWVSVLGNVSGSGVNQWDTSGAAVQLHGSGNARWMAPVLIGTRVQSLGGKETRWTVTVRYARAEASVEGL